MNDHAFLVRVAGVNDLASILDVQRQAFTRVAVELDIDPSRMPPLTEQRDDLLELLGSGTTFFIAVDTAGAVVGSVRATPFVDRVEIGRLVVGDGWTRQGVATALMNQLETLFADTAFFQLFTGADAAAPLALYRRRGYVETHREEGHVELVWLRKYPVTHD